MIANRRLKVDGDGVARREALGKGLIEQLLQMVAIPPDGRRPLAFSAHRHSPLLTQQNLRPSAASRPHVHAVCLAPAQYLQERRAHRQATILRRSADPALKHGGEPIAMERRRHVHPRKEPYHS
jgi:hypothetical protein